MGFYIVLVGLSCLIMVLFTYRKYSIEIELQESKQFQGIQMRAHLPLYTFEQIYDYSDPKLHLLEAMLIDRLDKGFSGKVAFDWGMIKRFLISVSRIKLVSDWEIQSFFLLKKLLAFTVIEKLQWESSVGGDDAMFAALHTGAFWAFKGMVLAFISHNSKVEQIKVSVKTDFQTSSYFSKISCILKIRIVHIITIAIYIIVWKVRWWVNGYTARATEQPSH